MGPQKEIAVRTAIPEDSTGILRCLREAFEPYRKAYTPAAFLDTVLTSEALVTRLHTMTIFVAAATEGEIVGTIACRRVSESQAHLRGMAVLPAWHGKGIAQLLLETAQAEIRAWGCSRVTLNTTQPLERAVHFYRKNGFTSTGAVRDSFGMPLYEFEKKL
jgi:GNAT superfamily N-acetyltransferase